MSIQAPTVELKNVVAGYVAGNPILRGLSLTAKAGQITVVLGPNGAGKSTTLRVLAGYLPVLAGELVVGGVDVSRLPPYQHLAHGIGLLPQGRSTFAEMTVAENIELGAWVFRTNRALMRDAIEDIYVRYPHLRDLRQRVAGSLSGGQQRAVEIARLLVGNPTVLLIDEPSVGLSPVIASMVYEELLKLRDEGRTVILVDQDVRAAIKIADYVYVLSSGKNDLEGDRTAFDGDLGAMVHRWLGI